MLIIVAITKIIIAERKSPLIMLAPLIVEVRIDGILAKQTIKKYLDGLIFVRGAK